MKKTQLHFSQSREDWLRAYAEEFIPDFAQIGYTLQLERIRISCGFPTHHALGRTKRVLGQCFSPYVSTFGVTEIFINPTESDSLRVGDILVHELIHAVVGVECGHRGPFRIAALALGLEGPMTATTAGESLKQRLNALQIQLGPYPHGSMFPDDNSTLPRLPGSHLPKKQSTRLIKIQCSNCGYVARTSRRWIEVGFPICPCGEVFTLTQS